MRFLSRLALLLLLAHAAFGVATTTLDCRPGGDVDPVNKVTQATVNATENVVTVTVAPGHPVTLQIYSSTAWYFRSVSAADGTTHDTTTQEPVAALQVDTIRITATTTFYQVRQSADGTLYLRPLKIE